MCARRVWHPGSYPAPTAPEVSIFEFPLLDPIGLRQELTDQDEQSGDDGGDGCLFTDMSCRLHTCPLSLETHKAEVVLGLDAEEGFC